MSIKVLLVDDHAIIREGLCSLLKTQPGLEVIADTDDGRKALDLVRELMPNVVVMDITMPRLNGIEAARQIVAEFPDVKVIALSIYSKRRFVADMLRAGATGYILKECLFDELVQAIKTVDAGGRYLSPKITDVIISDYIKRLSATADSPFEVLKTREREVLQLLAEGKSTKQIALELHVSTKTIEANRRQIMEKLDIHSIAELTKYAVREGLTTLET